MMTKRMVAITLVMMLLISFPTSAGSDSDTVSRAVTYLRLIQNSDGGFPTIPGRNSNVSTTCWVVMALTAAGEDLSSTRWSNAGKTPEDYLLSLNYVPEATTDYAKMIMALSALGRNTIYNNVDLLETLRGFQQSDGAFYQPELGEKGMINAHIWSVLAIGAAGSEIPDREGARVWLTEAQNEDGGFSWYVGADSDSDDTAAALQALALLNDDPDESEEVRNGLAYIKTCQNSDGGFYSSSMMGTFSNIASDAWILQALIAVGEDEGSGQWQERAKILREHMAGLQKEDGSFEWRIGVTSSAVQMTAYAVTALSGMPYPIINGEAAIEKSSFSDIDRNYWCYEAISTLASEGIINGYPDGRFIPDATVTRAEFTTMLMKVLGTEDNTENVVNFNDLPEDHWAYRYVCAAYGQGLIHGKSERIFDPDGNINGAELATIAVNTMTDEDRALIEEGDYWYSGNVAYALKVGLLYPEFSAVTDVTRSQCAYTLWLLSQRLER